MNNIYITNDNITIVFAANELSKYLQKITNNNFNISTQTSYNPKLNGIWLLTSDEIDLSFKVEDKILDDGILVDINKGHGTIAGTNERSVLLGVYKFLTKLGCRWLRPSLDGEILVQKNINDIKVYTKETPSYRHRGIVIEGANSYQNVLDMIDWLPKLGYNSYFIQFMYAYSFFYQWYAHTNNPLKNPEAFTDDMAIEFTNKLIQEIKKRGLILHSVGHGWTSETLDIPGRGWDPEEHHIDPKYKKFLAKINNKRDFYHNIPINTNLCYSSIDVQEKFSDSVVNYAKENPDTNMLHVWLADDFNNHCECSSCKKLTPTDWYIQILNMIDSKLSIEGLSTKIVFLLYFELLWTPQKEKINNPDRFLMMFAPISRSFNQSYKNLSNSLEYEIPPFSLNSIKLPTNVNQYMQFLKQWQHFFKGDSFDFDYHLGRAHYGDPGYYHISKIISDDIKSLKDLGLNGLMSCQQQRSFFPTGLPNYVMAKTLWDVDADFDNITDDYFSHMFGDDYKKCIKYLSEVSNTFDIDYWHLERGGVNNKAATKLNELDAILSSFTPVVKDNLNNKDHNIAQTKSWKYLSYHLEYTRLLGNTFRAKAKGENSIANSYWTEFANYIRKNEDELQKVLDVFRILTIGQNLNKLEILK